MPNNIIKSFADKTDRSIEQVEKLWDKAKEIVKKQYPKVEVDSDKYYQLVTGVLKKALKIDEVITTTSANIGDGQSGQHKKKVGPLVHRYNKKKKK